MEEVIWKRRVVSVTCHLDAQHLTRLAETFAISPDHASEGSFAIVVTPTSRLDKMLFYDQGITLDVPTKTTPRLPLDLGKRGV